MEPVISERNYYIHYYEVDYMKRCLITSIMNYFEDLALIQSEKLGIGMDYLNKSKLAWVLYKWDIKVKRYPHFGETIKITTMPCSFKKFYAYRKFDIYDNSGNNIVSANSVWLLVDVDTKKLSKINDHIYKVYQIDEGRETLEIGDMEKLDKIDSSLDFHVRYSDIDTNKHVNNVKYVDWSIETIPLDIVLNYELKRLKVTYKKETAYGENIKAVTELSPSDNGVVCIHKILDNNGSDLCLLETTWVK